jgi:hypothetical protein
MECSALVASDSAVSLSVIKALPVPQTLHGKIRSRRLDEGPSEKPHTKATLDDRMEKCLNQRSGAILGPIVMNDDFSDHNIGRQALFA